MTKYFNKILDRDKENMNEIKFEFEEEIDITQFVIEKEKSKIIYCLYSIISDIGKSYKNKEFIASCKSPVNNSWYQYNNDIVKPINNIQKEIIYFGVPYILFYQKK